MSRSILTAFAASVFAVASFAGEGLVFPPSPWGEMKIVRGEKCVQIKDAKGKSVIEVFTEGGAGAVCDACGKPVRSANAIVARKGELCSISLVITFLKASARICDKIRLIP